MTIKELIIKLKEYPEDMRVFVSDGEDTTEITTDTRITIEKFNSYWLHPRLAFGEEYLDINMEEESRVKYVSANLNWGEA
tara:strand:+ start:321 stop:560 length:240 start_codon:yes stop_codon:yes gene_type:complete